MKFQLYILLIALIAVFGVCAAPVQKAVIVSYPNDTPNSVLDQAKDAIRAAGGVITHEYSLIKAFAANAPAKVLQSVEVMGTKYNAVVEEDQVVSINDGQ